MSFKTCPACRHVSYCAAGCVIWICPCCGQDISRLLATRDPRRETESPGGRLTGSYGQDARTNPGERR